MFIFQNINSLLCINSCVLESSFAFLSLAGLVGFLAVPLHKIVFEPLKYSALCLLVVSKFKITHA